MNFAVRLLKFIFIIQQRVDTLTLLLLSWKKFPKRQVANSFGSQIVSETDLLSFAIDAGIDGIEFEHAYSSEAPMNAADQVLREALERKIFGVPTFMLGEKMFWGNDRLPLLMKELLDLEN